MPWRCRPTPSRQKVSAKRGSHPQTSLSRCLSGAPALLVVSVHSRMSLQSARDGGGQTRTDFALHRRRLSSTFRRWTEFLVITSLLSFGESEVGHGTVRCSGDSPVGQRQSITSHRKGEKGKGNGEGDFARAGTRLSANERCAWGQDGCGRCAARSCCLMSVLFRPVKLRGA